MSTPPPTPPPPTTPPPPPPSNPFMPTLWLLTPEPNPVPVPSLTPETCFTLGLPPLSLLQPIHLQPLSTTTAAASTTRVRKRDEEANVESELPPLAQRRRLNSDVRSAAIDGRHMMQSPLPHLVGPRDRLINFSVAPLSSMVNNRRVYAAPPIPEQQVTEEQVTEEQVRRQGTEQSNLAHDQAQASSSDVHNPRTNTYSFNMMHVLMQQHAMESAFHMAIANNQNSEDRQYLQEAYDFVRLNGPLVQEMRLRTSNSNHANSTHVVEQKEPEEHKQHSNDDNTDQSLNDVAQGVTSVPPVDGSITQGSIDEESDDDNDGHGHDAVGDDEDEDDIENGEIESDIFDRISSMTPQELFQLGEQMGGDVKPREPPLNYQQLQQLPLSFYIPPAAQVMCNENRDQLQAQVCINNNNDDDASVTEQQSSCANGQHMCSVCLSNFRTGDELRTLYCWHLYHRNCIDTWLLLSKGHCPICRVPQYSPPVCPFDSDVSQHSSIS